MAERYGARAGRVMQVIVRVWAFRINEMVAIAVLSRGMAEPNHSWLCSLWSVNKHRKIDPSDIINSCLLWRPLQASGSSQMIYRLTSSSLAWRQGWVERAGLPTACESNNLV